MARAASQPGQKASPSITSPRVRRDAPALVIPIALALAWVFAFHGLAGWDPGAGARNSPDGIEGFFFSPAGSPPTLLLILALWLTIRRRHDLFAAMARPESALATVLGFIAILCASGLSVWAHYIDFLGLLIPALSLMLLGGGLFLGGWRGALVLLVPILFLVLAFPHPAVALNKIIFPMQLWTAESTVRILDMLGVDSLLAGDLILMSDRRVFQVIESCAGLRSIETLLMGAAVYAEIFGRRGAHALILLVAAPLLGVLVNQVRVLSLIANPFANIDPVHTAQGIVMIVVGVLLIALLDLGLKRLPFRRIDRSWTHTTFRWRPDSNEGLRRGASRALAFCVLLVVIGASTLILPPWSPTRERLPLLSSLSARLGDWRAAGLKIDEQFFGSVGFVQWVHRRYFIEKGDSGVEVFLAANNRLEPRMSLISDKTGVPGPGYTLMQKTRIQLEAGGREVNRLLFRRLREDFVVYHWYQNTEPLGSELLRSALALDRGPLRRPGRATLARLSMRMPLASEDWPAAERQLMDLATRVEAELSEMRLRVN